MARSGWSHAANLVPAFLSSPDLRGFTPPSTRVFGFWWRIARCVVRRDRPALTGVTAHARPVPSTLRARGRAERFRDGTNAVQSQHTPRRRAEARQRTLGVLDPGRMNSTNSDQPRPARRRLAGWRDEAPVEVMRPNIHGRGNCSPTCPRSAARPMAWCTNCAIRLSTRNRA